MNDCSNVSDTTERSRRKRVMNVDVLSVGERAYVLGLYFADGCMVKKNRSSFRVQFDLQGDERDIVGRIVGMFRRSGLNPCVYERFGGRNMFRVVVIGGNLPSLFPRKRVFLSSAEFGDWVREKGFDGGELAVPFVAGLVDGDGTCLVQNKSKYIFGSPNLYWSFSQIKYKFLADYLVEYVRRLGSGGVHFRDNLGRRARVVEFSQRGRDALVRAGIACWSFKVARCLKEFEEAKGEVLYLKAKFWKPSQVAQRLHVTSITVHRWCKLGYIEKFLRIRGLKARRGSYSYLIPVEEIQRLEAEERTRAAATPEGERYLSVGEAARLLGVSESSVHRYVKDGKLRVVSVQSCGGWKSHKAWKYYVASGEVEKLRGMREEENEKKEKGCGWWYYSGEGLGCCA